MENLMRENNNKHLALTLLKLVSTLYSGWNPEVDKLLKCKVKDCLCADKPVLLDTRGTLGRVVEGLGPVHTACFLEHSRKHPTAACEITCCLCPEIERCRVTNTAIVCDDARGLTRGEIADNIAKGRKASATEYAVMATQMITASNVFDSFFNDVHTAVTTTAAIKAKPAAAAAGGMFLTNIAAASDDVPASKRIREEAVVGRTKHQQLAPPPGMTVVDEELHMDDEPPASKPAFIPASAVRSPWNQTPSIVSDVTTSSSGPNRKFDPNKPFLAKFAGRCKLCDKNIVAGVSLIFRAEGGGARHDKCPESLKQTQLDSFVPDL